MSSSDRFSAITFQKSNFSY